MNEAAPVKPADRTAGLDGQRFNLFSCVGKEEEAAAVEKTSVRQGRVQCA